MMNNNNQNQNQNWNYNTNTMPTGGVSYSPNPAYNLYWNMQQQQRLPIYTAAPIHGENAAWQFPMGPNSEIYLPDADQDIIWWIRTDNNGNKNVQAFDVKPHEEPVPVDMNDLAARLAIVEEWINAKQNKPNTKRHTNTAATTNPTPAPITTERVD